MLVTVTLWSSLFACGAFNPTEADRSAAVRYAVEGATFACAQRAAEPHSPEPELDELCARLLGK